MGWQLGWAKRTILDGGRDPTMGGRTFQGASTPQESITIVSYVTMPERLRSNSTRRESSWLQQYTGVFIKNLRSETMVLQNKQQTIGCGH